MEERVSNHPCHRLSIPSAKLFWCRHCMQSFEDPINRWRHSKTCKTGGPSNHDKRLEQDPFALQTYVETKQKANNVDCVAPGLLETITGEQLMIIKQETVENEPKAEYSCFICKRPFSSLEDMKEHVKYPCSKNDSYDEPVYIPGNFAGTSGVYVETTHGFFPNSSRKAAVLPVPIQQEILTKPDPPPVQPRIIQRQPVLGEIVEQSADPNTGIRTFEVHSQNDDIPLSEILSKLSEGGYLVAGEDESPVNQVVVVQQVDEQGQITQTEHILPPHIQIQQIEESESAVDNEQIEASTVNADEIPSPDGGITYYITESGELIQQQSTTQTTEVKIEKPDLFYNEQLTGMNILTQAAEATIGNLIYPEKRKLDEDQEDEENVKRSRTQCKPMEDISNNDPPHSPRSPRQPDGNSTWNRYTVSNNGTEIVIKTEKPDNQNDNGNGTNGGKQQTGSQNLENAVASQDGKHDTSSCETEQVDINCMKLTVSNPNESLLTKLNELPTSGTIDNSGNASINKIVTYEPAVSESHLDQCSQNNNTNNQKDDSETFKKIPDNTPKSESDNADKNSTNSNISHSETTGKENKSKKAPNQPNKKKRRNFDDEDCYQCKICDRTFKTSQLLSRHAQYPCKVFNTRNMSQKVLRPKRGTSASQLLNLKKSNTKGLPSNSIPKSSPASRCSNAKVYRKPMLLLNGLKVSTLFTNTCKKKRQKIKKKLVHIPTLPSVKKIWLPGKDQLLVQNLPEKEQYFYELGLVSTYHIDRISDVESTFLPNSLNVSLFETKTMEDKIKNVFTPLMISTDFECGKNTMLLDDINFSPPVLERMYIESSPDLTSPKLSVEPPVLTAECTAMENTKSEIEEEDMYDLDFSDISYSDTTKATDKRHFMDLFIEANSDTAQKQLDVQKNFKSDQKTPINMLLKSDLISKLADGLKKKFSSPGKLSEVHQTPQTLSVYTNKSPSDVKQCLLSRFDENISKARQIGSNIEKFNQFPKQTSGTSIANSPTKKTSIASTPTKLKVIVYKQKVQDEASNSNILGNSSQNDIWDWDQIDNCIYELLDSMLINVSQNPENALNKYCVSKSLDSQSAEHVQLSELLDTMVTEVVNSENQCDSQDSNSEIREVLNSVLTEVLKDQKKSEFKGYESDFGISCHFNDDIKKKSCSVISEFNPSHVVNESNNCNKSFIVNGDTDIAVNYSKNNGENNFPHKNYGSRKEVTDNSNFSVNKSIKLSSKYDSYIQISKSDTVCVPQLLDMISNQNNSAKSTKCTLPQFLLDEGIVGDITDTKNECHDSGYDLFSSDEESGRPKVTVQYINQVETLTPLTSDILNSEPMGHYDSIHNGSPDYLVNKIAFSEEEVVLSDSGLDDGDELVSQNILESDQNKNIAY